MAGLFGILDVASRGLLVMQRGVRVTGHNIANAETPGYSRQRQVLGSVYPVQAHAGIEGMGVEQLSIERFTDQFVQAQLVKQKSALNSSDAQSQALSQIEEILNEQDSDGVGQLLSRLYDSFSDLASSPTPGAPVERSAVLSSGQSIVDTLHATDRQLRDLQASADSAVRSLVGEVNEIAKQIDALNGEIQRIEVSANANDLRDQREMLVRDLSGLIDVSTYEQADGELVVLLPSGMPLVEGGSIGQLVAVPDLSNPFNPGFAQIHYQSGSSDFDVTGDIGGGQVGGLLRARDTIYPGAIRSLDTVAYNLGQSVNGVHGLGTGIDGSVGDFFTPLAGVENAARDIALDANVQGNPDAIAAGLTTAPGDNRNAQALAGLRDAATAIFLPGDPPGPASGPTRSLLEHVASVVSDIGQQTRTMDLSSRQQGRIVEGLENRRDEVSGVSIDEEVTNLIRLQAAFQANSRVVAVVDRLLQDVLDLI